MKRTAIALCLTAATMLGVAVPAGAQTLSPASANFPPTPFRQNSAPITFTFTNTSAAPVLSGVATENTYTSGSFFETNNCPSIYVDPGGSCSISVVFSPYTVQPAAKSGTLHAGGVTAPLTGTGYTPGSGGKKKCKKGKKRAAVAKKKRCGKKKR